MFSVGVLVEIRRDGKLYPPVRRSAAEVAAIRALEHGLHCRQGLTFRQVQAALLDQHEIRRSIGSVHRDLTGWRCPYCPAAPKPPAPPAPPARVKAVPVPWR